MTKTLTPPPATRAGDSVLSFVGSWQALIARREWWRMTTERVDSWLRISLVFAGDVNGPWAIEETDLRALAEAFRCIGDGLSKLGYLDLHYLMLCIRAVDSALLIPADPEPANDAATKPTAAPTRKRARAA